jgi:hypothetical protein
MLDKATALYNLLAEDLSAVLDVDALALVRRKDSQLWPDATLAEARAFAIGKSLTKKFRVGDRPTKDACRAALEKFHEGNEACGQWVAQEYLLRDSELINGVSDVLHRFWNSRRQTACRCDRLSNGCNHERVPLVSSLNEVYMHGRLGPGSNVGGRDADLYTKLFDSPLSYTKEDLAFVWSRLASDDPRWANAERHRNQRHGYKQVAGNKLSFVSKNADVARSISSEPTINMWFQLGFGAILEGGLKSFFGISLGGPEGFNQPSVNRSLARIGSRTGRFVTIDLENASNSISLGMIRRVVPKDMMAYMTLFRSPVCMLPDGTSTELKMVATMGNGFCFPLQTALFAAVVATAYHHLGIKLQTTGPAEARNFGVFGDDIICVPEASRLVLHVLGLLGFKANASKTFIEGPFRESCGGDFWNGHHCRGVYIKTLRTRQDAVAVINALNRWSAMSGIALPTLCGHLSRLWKGMKFVPPYESDDAGVHVPLGNARAHSPYPGVHTYLKDTAAAVRLEIGAHDIRLEKRWSRRGMVTKERSYNDYALQLCFLHGSIRGTSTSRPAYISLRQRNTVYLTTKASSPNWDCLGPDAVALEVTWARLATAILENIPELLGV